MSEIDYYQEEQLKSERTENETDKKCPNCGATVTFDPASGMMHCDYCGYIRVLALGLAADTRLLGKTARL